MASQVNAREMVARRQTEAAILRKKIELIYFRPSMACRSLLEISQGIAAVQTYCLTCTDL